MNYLKILSPGTALLTLTFLTGISPSYASTMIAGVKVLDPNELLAGKTQAEWGDLWWQYLYEIPLNLSPVFDETGENAPVNQSEPVYFLSGSFVAEEDELTGDFISTETRNVTVPIGNSLFFPILNVESNNLNEATGLTVDGLRTRANNLIDTVLEDDLFVIINGVPVPDISSYRQTSPTSFSYTVPENNILEAQLGDIVNNPDALGAPYTIDAFPATIFPSVSDGFWLGTESLPRGDHVIKFGGTAIIGENPDGDPLLFKLDITYNITSTSVPEPASSLGLLALGASGTALILRRGLRSIL